MENVADYTGLIDICDKWLEFFSSPETDIEIVRGSAFSRDCISLGFINDFMKSFLTRFGKYATDITTLEECLKGAVYSDIPCLGNACYSYWYFITHYPILSIDDRGPRTWFVMILKKIKELRNSFTDSLGRLPVTLRIRSCDNHFGYRERDTVTEQHFTLNRTGMIWLSSFASQSRAIEKTRMKIDREDACRILRFASILYESSSDPGDVLDAGYAYMTLTYGNRECTRRFIFGGSQIVEGTDISEYIRNLTGRRDLMLFDRIPPVREDAREYIYALCTFGNSDSTYWYISDDETLGVGDRVLVPGAYGDSISMCIIRDIERFRSYEAPYPPEKTKHIIRKEGDPCGGFIW